MTAGPGRGARRLFVAGRLPAHLAEAALALARARLPAAEWRFPRAEGLHFTLLFLGDTPAERAERLVGELGTELSSAEELPLVLGQPGAFPRRGDERVLWLGVGEGPGARAGALLALRERVLRAAEAAGCPVGAERERPFRAHVTVARPRRGGRGAAAPEGFHAAWDELPFRLAAVELLESVLGAGPRSYPTVAGFALVPAKG